MSKWIAIGFFILASASLGQFSNSACAGTPGEAELLAAKITGEDISIWLEGLENRPGSIGVFAVHTAQPLGQEYASILESQVLKETLDRKQMRVVSCLECRSARVQAEGDHLTLVKGSPDVNALRELGRKLGVESFLVLDVYRTSLSVFTQATLYQVATGEILSAQSFRVPAFELSSAAMQLMLLGGPGRTVGYSPTQDDSVPFTLNALALEELGFGKGGLAVGGVFAGKAGKLGYIAPVVGFRSRLGATPISTLASIGAGMGLTSTKGGVAFRGSYDFYIGTFTIVGIQGVYLVPISGIKSGPGETLSGFAGVHLGIALGR